MDNSYIQSIASDIMQMLKSARDSGLALNSGFQNDAFKAERFSFGYLFYPRNMLLSIPNLPQSVRKKIKKSNILGMVDVDSKKEGIHLICSTDKSFDEISAEEIISGINKKELKEFKEQIAKILHKDLVSNVEEKKNSQ